MLTVAVRYTLIKPDASGGPTKREYDVGRVFILFQEKSGNFDDVNYVVIKGSDTFGQFGYRIEHAGDVNGDGLQDLFISAPYAGWDREEPNKSTGKVYTIFGNRNKDFCDETSSDSSSSGFQCLSEINIKNGEPNSKVRALGTEINSDQNQGHF